MADSKLGPAFITNRHNITGRHQDTAEPLSSTAGVPDQIVIAHHIKGQLGSWAGKLEALYRSDGSPRWFEHPTHGKNADMCALPITQQDGIDIYSYELTNEPRISVTPGDVLSVVGFPFGMSTDGLLPIWATGFVASEPGVKLNNSELPIFYIDCRSRPGQSGSAVVAHRSGGMVTMEDGSSAIFNGPATRLLGLYSGRVNAESDIGIVWKTDALREMLEACQAGT